MPKNNKIYWFEGVTEKGVKSLLNDQNSKFAWLRLQRNRRILVIIMTLGFLVLSLGSYWPVLKANLTISQGAQLVIFSTTAILVVLSTIVGYLLLRVSVRGIADAPDELLDERQIKIRNTSFRYSYYLMGYITMGLMILLIYGPGVSLFQGEGNDGSYLFIAVLFAFASLPSMTLAWREKDI
ncbi:MAG: hypothetical protein RIS22_25 [Actinomycetota bacterium]|jgi:amino acid transporter